MDTQINAVVEKYPKLRMQVNLGERHRIMRVDIHSGSLWVTPRSKDYCIVATGEVEAVMHQFLFSLLGPENGREGNKKWWFVKDMEDVRKIIRHLGESKTTDSTRVNIALNHIVKSDTIRTGKVNQPDTLNSTKVYLPSEDEPYALSSVSERDRRIKLLNQEHIAPLEKYLKNIRNDHPEKDLPYFDPCDGGINAKVLVLFEAPGPKAVGSQFISRNNPDPSARNVCELMTEAGVHRQDTILWNIVPWYVGDGTRIRPVDNADIQQALPYLEQLLNLLPELQLVILSGKKSQSARSAIRDLTKVPILEAHHPSARVFNVWPEKRKEVKEIFSLASKIVTASK